MASDYRAIRRENTRRYGTEVREYGGKLLPHRYGDRTHFIYELLQNAEDALARRESWTGARSVLFHLFPGELRSPIAASRSTRPMSAASAGSGRAPRTRA